MKTRRAAERARRAGDGAALGARRGIGRAGEAARAPLAHARAGRQRRHAAGRDHGPGAGRHRASTSWSSRGAEARGKIVLFDVPFTTYGETVRYRGTAPSAAARAGAVASLIRSVACILDPEARTPGRMRYDSHRRPYPRRRAQRRGRDDAAPDAGPRRAGRRDAADGRARRCPTRSRATSSPRSWAGRSRTRSS